MPAKAADSKANSQRSRCCFMVEKAVHPLGPQWQHREDDCNRWTLPQACCSTCPCPAKRSGFVVLHVPCNTVSAERVPIRSIDCCYDGMCEKFVRQGQTDGALAARGKDNNTAGIRCPHHRTRLHNAAPTHEVERHVVACMALMPIRGAAAW